MHVGAGEGVRRTEARHRRDPADSRGSGEDERTIHALEETNLLPPSQEVEAQIAWLRERKIRCWSGWEYIATNVDAKRQKEVVRQFPYFATGIVMLDADYDLVVELFGLATAVDRAPRLRAPLVIAPATALGDAVDVLGTVIGPSSDAHFDKKAGLQELNWLVEGKVLRQKTIGDHEEWQDALTTLKSILQQFHAGYPRGWFSEQRQKLDVAQSRLDEAGRALGRLDQQLLDLQAELDRAAQQLATAKLALAEQRRQRGLLEQYERSYGSHLEQWRSEINVCRDRAAKSRKQQEDLCKQAQEWESKSRESRNQAQVAFLRGSPLDVDRSKVKYVDDSLRGGISSRSSRMGRTTTVKLPQRGLCLMRPPDPKSARMDITVTARRGPRRARPQMMRELLDQDARAFLFAEARLQQIRERLLSPGRRVVRQKTVWTAFVESFSDLPPGPERRRWLAAVLEELSQQGEIRFAIRSPA